MIKVGILSETIIASSELRQLCERELSEFKANISLNFSATCRDEEILVVGKEKVDRNFLSKSPNLKAISKYGVGLNNIDFHLLRKKKILFYTRSGVNAKYVAEHALGQIIALSRNLFLSYKKSSKGEWFKNGGRSLENMVVGIVGLGHVGSALARLLQRFRAPIFYSDLEDKSLAYPDLKLKRLSYKELLTHSDIISFHVPLDEKTKHMLSDSELKVIKKDAYLVNTSRGEVIDTSALIKSLAKGNLAGVALDVIENEPILDPKLYNIDRVYISCHSAGNSKEAKTAMTMAALDGVKNYLRGKLCL